MTVRHGPCNLRKLNLPGCTAAPAFDPNLRAIVLFGGGSGGVDQNTTWEWLGFRLNWRQLLTTQSPPAREGAGIAYDHALHRVVIFGGQNSDAYLNDTWEFIP